jgi:hypothetical protein
MFGTYQIFALAEPSGTNFSRGIKIKAGIISKATLEIEVNISGSKLW